MAESSLGIACGENVKLGRLFRQGTSWKGSDFATSAGWTFFGTGTILWVSNIACYACVDFIVYRPVFWLCNTQHNVVKLLKSQFYLPVASVFLFFLPESERKCGPCPLLSTLHRKREASRI
mgnify:CR=1 FL=1